MKISARMPRDAHIPPSIKRDIFLLPTVFVFNCFLFSTWRDLLHVGTNPWLFLVWLYGLAALLPLVWRDRVPLTVFATQWVVTVAAWPILPAYTPVVGVPISMYAVAFHRNWKVSLLMLLASLIPNGVAASVAFRNHPTLSGAISSFIPNIIFLVLVTISAWGAGRVSRAKQLRLQELEHERQTAQEAVLAERGRIARELHDIVSHAVTVMVLQAAGAARVAETNFAQVTQSLTHIEATGKQAMAELRRLLGVLQASDPKRHTPEMNGLGPQPGLADLPALLNSLHATGMPVAYHTEGAPRDLDPSVDLAAYRIVQEGLTNVLKHAGQHANPRLRLAWDAYSLQIQIDNDTNSVETSREQELSSGCGLVGLRERVHAAGGVLLARPHHGGYRLTATLPLASTQQIHPHHPHEPHPVLARDVADQPEITA